MKITLYYLHFIICNQSSRYASSEALVISTSSTIQNHRMEKKHTNLMLYWLQLVMENLWKVREKSWNFILWNEWPPCHETYIWYTYIISCIQIDRSEQKNDSVSLLLAIKTVHLCWIFNICLLFSGKIFCRVKNRNHQTCWIHSNIHWIFLK